MDEALLKLLENKNYEFITVKELCTKAGVNRSTFYLHYETMNDLLLESIEYITEQMNNKFQNSVTIDKNIIADSSLDELILITPEYLQLYLEFVKDNKKFFAAVIAQPIAFRCDQIFNSLYNDIFTPIMLRYGISEQDRKYTLEFYIKGIYAVIVAWIKNDCKDEIEHIADLIIKLVKPHQMQENEKL